MAPHAATRDRPKACPRASRSSSSSRPSDTPAGKREIAKAFGLKGQEKIALKRLLRDMAEEGLIDGKKTAFHRMGGVPKVTVLRVVDIEDGEAIAIPDAWQPDDGAPPPRLRLVEKQAGTARAARPATACSRAPRRPARGWTAHPMKKLPARERGDARRGRARRRGQAVAGAGRQARAQFLAHRRPRRGGSRASWCSPSRPAARPRAGVKVIEVLGDPLAPRALQPDRDPQVRHPARLPRGGARRSRARREAAAQRGAPRGPAPPADRRDRPGRRARPRRRDLGRAATGEGGFRAVVAIADVSFYVRPGGAGRPRGEEARQLGLLPRPRGADAARGAQRRRLLAQGRRRPRGDGLPPDDRRATAGSPTGASPARWSASPKSSPTRTRRRASMRARRASNLQQPVGRVEARCSRPAQARDPLELELPERRVVLDEQGSIAEIAVRERLDAHRVVEDFMIAANVAAAKALESKASPGGLPRPRAADAREADRAARTTSTSIGKQARARPGDHARPVQPHDQGHRRSRPRRRW